MSPETRARGVSGDVPELEGDIDPHRSVSSEVVSVANFFGVVEMMDRPAEQHRPHRADAPEAMLIGSPLRDNSDKAELRGSRTSPRTTRQF